MSDALEPVGVIKSYKDLIRTIRSERIRRGWSGETVDDLAGLPDRYTAKIENGGATWGRLLGDLSFTLLMGALDLRLVVCRDRNAKQRSGINGNGSHTNRRHRLTAEAGMAVTDRSASPRMSMAD